uniref:RIKEN cDNA A630001G21 gene n=1 Tax=Peromyscus maniculatus bairdii TaxID=230844 RepID=A0A8C8W0N2_PERMB
MLAVIQKEKSFNEIFSNYFKENKTEIAHAIPKLFPFLESLKDRSFITDKIYAHSYEAYRNLVPVENVVYNVLDHLEKLPDWSFLCTLFNRTNLDAYPGLREIHKSLETGNSFSHLPFKLATIQPRYEQGTNLHTHENWTGPCFVKQENLQKPGTVKNQEDEVIVISSEGSECSDEDDEKELLEVFALTPGIRRQIEEEAPYLHRRTTLPVS